MGGSSDFSTAEVTITLPTLEHIYIPNIILNPLDPTQGVLMAYVDIESETPTTIQVPLYKGASVGQLPSEIADSYEFVFSGGVLIDNTNIIVTGDGEFRFSLPK